MTSADLHRCMISGDPKFLHNVSNIWFTPITAGYPANLVSD
jgi:hypothetical protein